MTSIILSTVCALALNAAALPAQVDTNDIYLIDNVRIENFNGSQLAGKMVNSYVIRRENVGGTPVRIHFITTNAENVQTPAVVLMDQDFNNATVVSVGDKDQPQIRIRTTNPSLSVDDIIYIVDGKQIGSEEFKKLDPKNIKSMEVFKNASATKYLQDLKDQGKYQGETKADGGVIVVTLKK
jgi:hypothetical protein